MSGATQTRNRKQCSANTFADVVSGDARWSCEKADVLEFLRALPDDSVDLLFTSPPYRKARTYGIGAGRDTEEWVAWMMDVVRAAAPKVKGLIAINCEGQTEDYQYHPTPYLLTADLHRAGFNLRRLAFFHRIGIPGSGGPDWLRADVEPIICITRPGKLPWSDNTACGHPPKWGLGGEMSNRTTDGQRANDKELIVYPDGPPTMEERKRLGAHRARRNRRYKYVPAEVSNPGNVIHCNVGGGAMGHSLAHENEAPFPLDLPAFFVLSFCPPGGVVCDPFAGSGTTIDAAVQHGRRAIGCDARESQVELTRRRMSTVTPSLFTE